MRVLGRWIAVLAAAFAWIVFVPIVDLVSSACGRICRAVRAGRRSPPPQ
jgi:ABC-type branched-subunit amino acid transport system permease subunit